MKPGHQDTVRYVRLVGATLVQVRADRHLSCAEVARCVGIRPETLAKYESGSLGLTVAILVAVCRTLDVPPGAVVSDADRLLDRVIVDVRLVANPTDPVTRVLRQWAADRAGEWATQPVRALVPVVALCPSSIRTLARSHQVDPVTLTRALAGVRADAVACAVSGTHRLQRHHSTQWAMPRRLGDLLRAMRQRQGWTYADVARRDSTGSLVGILQSVETGGAAHVTLDGLTAVCEALGTSLGRALLAVESTAGATEDAGRRPLGRPAHRPDRPWRHRAGQDASLRRSPVDAADASRVDHRVHRRGVELDREPVAGRRGRPFRRELCELLGILNLFEITGSATTPWIRLLPLPCAHHDTTSVVTCTSCGAQWPPADAAGLNFP